MLKSQYYEMKQLRNVSCLFADGIVEEVNAGGSTSPRNGLIEESG